MYFCVGNIIKDGKLYVIGGSMGQKTVTDCERYDLKDKKWAPVAKLKIGRYSFTCVR